MKRKFTTLLIIIINILYFNVNSWAQNTTNYANVKVDELSDAQIRQMIQRAESVGYNDAQLEQMATAQGMKQEELGKLRARVARIRKQGDAGGDKTVPKVVEDDSRQYTDTSSKKGNGTDVLESLKPKIFGADLFKNNNITFEPNLRMATPKNYVIGPDDELLVDLTGDNEASYRLKVSPDGTIR
eukprot:gene12980-15856_t